VGALGHPGLKSGAAVMPRARSSKSAFGGLPRVRLTSGERPMLGWMGVVMMSPLTLEVSREGIDVGGRQRFRPVPGLPGEPMRKQGVNVDLVRGDPLEALNCLRESNRRRELQKRVDVIRAASRGDELANESGLTPDDGPQAVVELRRQQGLARLGSPHDVNEHERRRASLHAFSIGTKPGRLLQNERRPRESAERRTLSFALAA